MDKLAQEQHLDLALFYSSLQPPLNINLGGPVPDACVRVCKMVQGGLTERTLWASCGNLETEKFQPSWSCNLLASSEMLLQVCYCTGGGEWS